MTLLTGFVLVACGDDGSDDGSVSGTTGTTGGATQASVTESASATAGQTGGVDESGTTSDAETGATTGTAACASPDPWSAPDWDTNAAEALALRQQLATLVGDATMRGAEEGAVAVPDVSVLTDVYEGGTPTLASVTTTAFDSIVRDSFDEFVALIAAGQQDLIDDMGEWTPGPAGGIFGEANRGFNTGGVEVRQIVDKGLFSGGAFYNYAVGLTAGEIDAATIDAIAAIWGSNAMLDPAGELDDSAGYSHGMGFFADMADALTTAKAYATDSECVAERDEALVTFFRLWEQAMMARMVYYANGMATELVNATTDSDFAEALHLHAEGLGLASGFYGLPEPDSGPLSEAGARVITDAQLESMMDAFLVDLSDLEASTMGSFVSDLPAFETAQATAEGIVMEVYGVDAATIASWRMPTAG